MGDLPTYVIIQVFSKCSDEALREIIDQLKRPWESGGGGLELTFQQPRQNFPESIIHVSAKNEHIIRIAEKIEVKKEDNEGFIRPISVADIDQFPESGLVGPLTLSDVQRCIIHAMNRVHFDIEVTKLPGHGASILKGAPVLSSYEEKHLVNIIPVHDEEDLDRLYKQWKRNYFESPIYKIRDYFGESVALYFSFESVYTRFLVLVAVFGIIQYCLETYLGIDHVTSNVLFTLFIILAVGIYLEAWKRRSNEHSFYWGSSGKLRRKPPRPEFRGELRESPITGKQEMHYPQKKTLKKVFFVSVPVTIACLSLAVTLMLFSFTAEVWMMEALTDPETGEMGSDLLTMILSNLPSVTYSLSIIVFNSVYLKIARKLTVWENHRTQEQHDTHITLKLVIFEFVNTFLALFYTGFYMKDIKALKSQLTTTLLVQQIVNQAQEVLIPFFLQKPASVKFVNKLSQKLGIQDKPKQRNLSEIDGKIAEMSEDDPRGEVALKNLTGNHLESLHDDFMELWLQFGHVFLFISVYPLGAVLALLNNVTEMWADRYKICKLCSKPRPHCIRDIGAWYFAFRLIGLLSIVTNCWLLSLDLYPTTARTDLVTTDLEWFLGWVLVEHLLLVVFLGLDKLISDMPAEVKLALDKQNFHLKKKVMKEKND